MVEATLPIKNVVVDVNMPQNTHIKMKKVTIKNFFDQCLETLTGKNVRTENILISKERNQKTINEQLEDLRLYYDQ